MDTAGKIPEIPISKYGAGKSRMAHKSADNFPKALANSIFLNDIQNWP